MRHNWQMTGSAREISIVPSKCRVRRWLLFGWFLMAIYHAYKVKNEVGYTLSTINRWQCICDHNSWKISIDFYIFSTVVSRKECFTRTWQKFTPHLNNVLTLLSENENITFHTFIMQYLSITCCVKHGKVHRVKRKQIDSQKICSKCPPLARTQARSPLVNSVINQRLLQAAPHMQ